MALLWVVAPCSLVEMFTDVSGVPAASIIRATVTILSHIGTRRREDLNFYNINSMLYFSVKVVSWYITLKAFVIICLKMFAGHVLRVFLRAVFLARVVI
jgi:hypothetical protein